MNDLERLIRFAGRRPEPGAEARDRARGAAHEAWTHAVDSRRRRRRAFIMYPALAAAAALTIMVWPSRPAPPRVVGSMAGASLTAGSVVQTHAGERAVLALEGGGQLRLNSETTIRLTGVGHVELSRGHIYVDAGDAGGAPLNIHTPAGLLQDIGTRFDVRLDDMRIHVRVRDGLVRLTHASGPVDVAPGQQLSAERGVPVTVTPVATYGPDWDWIVRAAPFHADGARLDAFLRWVETDGGLAVHFDDPDLRQRKSATILHGSIDGMGLTSALDVILAASGLTYRVDGARIVITEERPSR